MNAVFKREFRSYFTGGIGFAYFALFIFLTNLSYQKGYVEQFSSNFVGIFATILGYMLFLIPILTMRIWSEEKKQKTDQLLLTAPVTPMQLVMGKFMAAMAVYILSLALTFTYPLITYAYGTVEWVLIIGNYIAIICVAAAYIAICQFMSCLTESQIISAILSLATLMCFSLVQELLPEEIMGMDFFGLFSVYEVASFVSIELRFMNFVQGIFALSDIVYFISIAAFFLFVNSRVIDKRRWS